MQISFLEFDTKSTWGLAAIGPAYIAAAVRQAGHQAALLRIAANEETATVVRRIKAQSPDVLGVSLTARQVRRAMTVLRRLKRQIDLPVIAGGIQAGFTAQHLLATGLFDAVCLGEGEAATCDLLDQLQNRNRLADTRVPNIWVNGGSRPHLRPPADLETLPFPARDLLDEQHGILYIASQRGCPYRCPYCAGGAMHRLYGHQRYHRQRSVGNVLAEIRQACGGGRPGYIVFLDDTFTASPNWVADFCRNYRCEFGAGFSISTRVETINRTLLDQLAGAGCTHIAYGVESGSPRVRREILQRPLADKRFIEVFRWTGETGIMASANWMIGLPGETKNDIDQTLALHARLNADYSACFIFYPFPGTPLFDLCRRKDFLPSDFWSRSPSKAQTVLHLPQLPSREIAAYYQRMERL